MQPFFQVGADIGIKYGWNQAGGAGGQASVFVRGTNSNHVLVLRDGAMPLPILDAKMRRWIEDQKDTGFVGLPP